MSQQDAIVIPQLTNAVFELGVHPNNGRVRTIQAYITDNGALRIHRDLPIEIMPMAHNTVEIRFRRDEKVNYKTA